MLEHQAALKKIFQAVKPLPGSSTLLKDALGCVLLKDLDAPAALPSFDNSAVDGYAVRFSLKQIQNESLLMFKVVGEIAAGETNLSKLMPGTAVQIFTGAPIPPGTDAVVMQENVFREKDSIQLSDLPKRSENIRFQGEDVRKGKALFKKGTILGPTHIGLLAAMGYARVPVISQPKVSILSTGNELKNSGEKIKRGEIFDSNTPLLRALVQESGCAPICFLAGRDHRAALKKKIRQGLCSDVLLIAGGVSVGKYDFVKEVLKGEGVREIFWKVNIKPGKPLFFGRKGKTLVFGLPGNPVSVFVTFQEYVKPALQLLQGKKVQSHFEKAKMTTDYQNGPRRHFVRCFYTVGKLAARVRPMTGQGSHMIGSLAEANAILEIPAGGLLRRNQEVTIKLI